MSYLLRRALLEDLPEIISHEAELFGADAWSPELVVAEISHPASYYVVAVPENSPEIVGYAGLRADPRGGDADIQTIAVVPEHRGLGLGRLLVEELLTEARAQNAHQVFLEVRADNEPALGLYDSLGFVGIDRRVGYYQPDGVDAIVMRLELVAPIGPGAVGHD